jgi:hypothetical protein
MLAYYKTDIIKLVMLAYYKIDIIKLVMLAYYKIDIIKLVMLAYYKIDIINISLKSNLLVLICSSQIAHLASSNNHSINSSELMKFNNTSGAGTVYPSGAPEITPGF